jgi:hypothetical protein
MRLVDLKRLAMPDPGFDGGNDGVGKKPRRLSTSSETVGSARDGSTMARKRSRAPEDEPPMKSGVLSKPVGSARSGLTMARKRSHAAEGNDAKGEHLSVKRWRTAVAWFGFTSLFG